MSALKSTILGIVFGCILYAIYLARLRPAKMDSFRSYVRKEAEIHNIHLPLSPPSAFQSSATFPDKTTDLKIELPVVKRVSFDPKESKQIHQPPVFPALVLHAPPPPPIAPVTVSSLEPSHPATAEDPLAARCNDLKTTYSVVPGSSWGTLTVELQGEWTKLHCDDHIKGSSNGSTSTSKVLEQLEAIPAPEQVKKKKQKRGKQHKGEEAGLATISGDSLEWCQDTMTRYDVKPMKSWGSAPVNMQDAWVKRDCDLVFTRGRMSKRPLSRCSDPLEKKDASTLPLIAIMAATTTRRVKDPSTKNMALFTYMLPSLVRSLDCGYRYEYVLGYDKGDTFYDSEAGMAEVRQWWKSNVEEPLSANGIKISLRLVRVNNTLKKPGPVFNEMARSAYQGGADYFYRVNDDTEMLANWPDKFVKALHSLPRPFGALGPVCHQGNQKILTHDFVSRLHMEIFEMNYYPPELTDWWMDDWISFVYGKSRTFKAAHIPVIHHTGAHGQRYEVNSKHEALLVPLIASGRQKIRQWMLKNNVPEEQLRLFDKDEYRAGFTHNDIPSE